MTEQQKNSSAFERLHPRIQQELYAMRWKELRSIQVQAIHSLLANEEMHLIISANTAGGKTEAAFLPILSQIIDNYTGSVRALYISPLKALINDQFRRLEDLCRRTEIPVHRWHGDVGQDKKKRIVNQPEGVLLITPESMEALFVNRPYDLPKIFGGLRFIVIDEMHSFMGSERGAHLRSLMLRVISKSKQ